MNTENLEVGTILLKCKLCPLVIADYEVANFYKNHYQTAHQDQIQTDQHYHQVKKNYFEDKNFS